MSLPPTTTIKTQLTSALGHKAPQYYHILREFLSGRISRIEFDEQVKEVLGKDNITTGELHTYVFVVGLHLTLVCTVLLHNSLIVSLLDPSAHLAPPTPPPDAPAPPPRKRRRTLPYQGEHDDGTLRSTRLKKWTIGIGKRERERLRGLGHVALSTERKPQDYKDEVAAERGVALLPERGGMSFQLCFGRESILMVLCV